MIDIQQLIEADQNLLLTLNGSDSMFWDGFMWIVSGTKYGFRLPQCCCMSYSRIPNLPRDF